MRWFRRKNRSAVSDLADSEVDTEVESSEDHADTPVATNAGPYDISEAPPREDELFDLGVLKVPLLANVAMKIDIDAHTRKPTMVHMTMEKSILAVQVCAAPKSAGIWGDVLEEKRELAAAQNAEITDQRGPLGRELVVKIPVRTPAGNGYRMMRYTGVEGPRWLLQATFVGEAATNPQAAAVLEDLVRQMVVDRGGDPHPPKQPIALTLPTVKTDEEQSPTVKAPQRGPEITETR